MADGSSVLVGLGMYVLVAATPAVLFWAVPRLITHACEWVGRLRERREPLAPEGPALESVVSDLRRLRRELRGAPPNTQVKRVALLSAYDGALLDTCRAIGVTDPPLATAEGADRPFARLLTEAAVEDAGVRLDPPAGGRAIA